MRVIISAVICIIISSCCVSKVSQGSDTTYITKVEYREILRDTTVFVPIIQEKVVNSTRDTSSRLETSYSISVAEINDGVLSHSLENKPYIMPIKVYYKDIARAETTESLVTNTIVQEVERDFLWWESALMWLGKIFLIVIVAAIAILVIKAKV